MSNSEKSNSEEHIIDVIKRNSAPSIVFSSDDCMHAHINYGLVREQIVTQCLAVVNFCIGAYANMEAAFRAIPSPVESVRVDERIESEDISDSGRKTFTKISPRRLRRNSESTPTDIGFDLASSTRRMSGLNMSMTTASLPEPVYEEDVVIEKPPMFKIGVIGCGKLATRIVSQMLDSELVHPENLIISTRRPELCGYFRDRGVQLVYDNVKVIRSCSVVLLCVLPQQVQNVARDLKTDFETSNLTLKNKAGEPVLPFFMSILSSVTTQNLTSIFSTTSVSRTRINMPQADQSDNLRISDATATQLSQEVDEAFGTFLSSLSCFSRLDSDLAEILKELRPRLEIDLKGSSDMYMPERDSFISAALLDLDSL